MPWVATGQKEDERTFEVEMDPATSWRQKLR
jgi:hypothetical protein